MLQTFRPKSEIYIKRSEMLILSPAFSEVIIRKHTLVLMKVMLSDPGNVPLHHGNDIAVGTGFAMGCARY